MSRFAASGIVTSYARLSWRSAIEHPSSAPDAKPAASEPRSGAISEAHACAADSTRRLTFCCCRLESTTGAADSYALSTPATTPLPIPSVAPQSSPLPAPHSPPTPRPT